MNISTSERLKSVKGIGVKRHDLIVTKLAEYGQNLDDFFAMPAEELASKFKLPKNVIQAIIAISTSPQIAQEPPATKRQIERSIRVLQKGQPDYPSRLETVLGKNAPERLYVWGNLALLEKPSIGFCGSRNVSDKGIDVTIDAARQIAEQDWVVVSGHARGVDTAAHRTALENNASTIIIAAEGIENFKLRKELKDIAKAEQILIISEFDAHARWSVFNAMKRNKTIIGLSDAMILIEARLEGGTFEAGKAALQLKTPLYVAEYQNPGDNAAGNEYFLKRGARPLKKSKETGQANITDLKANVGRSLETFEKNSVGKSEQLALKF